MQYLKYFLRNVNLLNTILIIIIILLSGYMVYPLIGVNIKLALPVIKKTPTDSEKETIQSQVPSPSDYAIIAEQNVFHPERKIPVMKNDEKPIAQKPDIVLYGTMITDEISLAYIEDKRSPQSTPGRGKRQTVLKKGDTIDGYTLKAIEADKIVMAREDDAVMVYLNDPQKPKTRESLASAIPPAPQQPVPQILQQPQAQQKPAATQAPVLSSEKEKQPLASDKLDSARKAFLDFFKR